MGSIRRVAAFLMLVATLITALPLTPAAAAAGIQVTTTSDTFQTGSGTGCSLREAIASVNQGKLLDGCSGDPSNTTITLPAGTYLLALTGAGEDQDATGDLDITSNITLSGAGMGQTIIGAAPGFGDRVFQVLSGGQLTLRNLSVSQGAANGDGGGILSDGTLTLDTVEVSNSTASGVGGGIASDGPTLHLTNSLIRGNTAPDGGGLALTGTTATIDGSAIVSNTAGPSSASGNKNGGGLYAVRTSIVTITNSTISDNSAATDGGGIFNASAQAAIQNTITLVNVTITANQAGRNSGGLDNFAVASIFNTIVAGNSAGQSSPDCLNASGHEITSQGYNLIGIVDGCTITGSATGNLSGTLAKPLDPTLSPLGFYGGPTPTHRQLLGSPVIDAGGNTGCPATDQRGVTRPGRGTGKAICDIGAVELSLGVSQTPDNTSWPNARPVTLSGGTGTSGDDLTASDQSRWYKFLVKPNSHITVTLTNLPANYDLTLYKDIGAAFQAFQTLDSTQDLAQLSAEFAPDAFSPDAYSPDAFSPDAFSPDAYSPDAFSPDAFSQDIFAPDAFSPDAYSPDAYSPDAFSPDAFSPDAYSPDAFSPDAYSPDAFSPDAYSPDAYSSAQTRSIIGVSAFNGDAGEGISLNTWDNSGYFYVRVRGRNGADVPTAPPFTVTINQTTTACSAFDGGTLPATSTAAVAGNYQTIILTDMARMSAQPGNSAADLGALTTQLNGFAASVGGVVVDVDNDARVKAANLAGDANPACPNVKNLAADSIKAIVDGYRQKNPGLKYIVIVGDDDVIPFYRYPDQALLASEQDFVPPVKDTSASQASLKLGYVLSQDRYGAALNLSYNITTLPIPQLAVGRLVETMHDVSTMLTAYTKTANGVITPSSALVTGYDFLADDAQAVQSQLATGLGSAGKLDSLITPEDVSPSDTRPYASGGPWTANDLKPLLLNQKHDLVFLAGHFSASSALAADYQTRVLTSDLLASPVDLTNEIIFSAGCHSGYNTVNSADVPGVTPEPDWAQAAASRGVTLIAGTGYQYGDTDFIKYSEELYLNFATQLRAGSGPMPLGQALVAAKVQFLGQTMQRSGIDQKALLEATLYGLPMLSVNMPGQRGTSPVPSIVSSTSPVSGSPGAMLGLTSADVTLNPALTKQTVTLQDIGGAGTHTATYYRSPDGVISLPFQPVLPLGRDNVSVPGTVVRGAGFLGGSYQDVTGVLPLTGAATSDLRGVHAAFQSNTFYPAMPWSLNFYDQVAGTGPPWLQVAEAQFKQSDPASLTGTMRVYNQMKFRLFYSNNIATYPANGSYPTTGDTPALAAAPAITRVAATLNNGVITFSANAVGDPTAGIQTVWVTYTLPPASGGPGQWISLPLTQTTFDSTLWQGTLPLSALGTTDASTLRFMAQAASGNGLVTLATNLGAYYSVGVPASAAGAPTQLSVTTSSNLSGAFGTSLKVSSLLTDEHGTPLPNQTVYFAIGAQRYAATTGSQAPNVGMATTVIQLLVPPGQATLRVSFNGTEVYAPSSASTTVTVTQQATKLTFTPNPVTLQYSDPGNLVATLTDIDGRPLGQRTIIFTIDGTSGIDQSAVHQVVKTITDFAGRAAPGPLNLPPGSYSVTANFGNVVTVPGGTITMTDPRFLPATASVPYTVTPEQATVAYTGDTFVQAGSPITLAATVAQDPDGSPGDITLAQVQFTITSSSGTLVQTVVAPVGANGTATTTVTLATPDVYAVQAQVVGGWFTSQPTTP
ncbi:MAG TPA: choice-of-anchor Q domain-containing protein, partial [Thermomicrobiaceae bacterium]|nr:choice-of-anchor Q domain-containing protein [Thermomicrobiaceae bacterium]